MPKLRSATKTVATAGAGFVVIATIVTVALIGAESVGLAGPTAWREHIANLVVDNFTLNGDTTSAGTIAAADLTSTDDVTVGDDLVVTGLATVGETLAVTGATTLTGAVTASTTLRVGTGTAMNEVFFQRHSYGGGGTTTQATVTGALATDTVVATVTASTNASYVVSAVPGEDTVDITLSADPGADSEISIIVIR